MWNIKIEPFDFREILFKNLKILLYFYNTVTAFPMQSQTLVIRYSYA